jgi:hypothetical protein
MSLVGECQIQTREVASAKLTVAVVHCHWRRPEACPECEPAVDRWLRQFAECGDRGAHRWASRCRWSDRVPAVPLPLPCRRSLVRVHRMKTARKRAAKVRNSSHRLAAQKCLHAARRFCLICMARPCRAGASRSRPQAGGAGRAYSTSLYRMAPVRPHGDKQVGTQVTVTAPARASWRNPIRRRPHSA